jgi:hypothetical protein
LYRNLIHFAKQVRVRTSFTTKLTMERGLGGFYASDLIFLVGLALALLVKASAVSANQPRSACMNAREQYSDASFI